MRLRMSDAELPLLIKEDTQALPTQDRQDSRRSRWSRALLAVTVGTSLSVLLYRSTSQSLSTHHDLPLCPSTEAIAFTAPRKSVSLFELSS